VIVGIEYESIVDRPLDEVFAWHTRAGAMPRLAEASQRVLPARLQALGHRFRQPLVEDALRHQLGHA
jgi:NAD dependent epimerase/dehydratase family enzyme